jgi:hypothetical protein
MKWNIFIVVLMIFVLLPPKAWAGEPFLMKESRRITKNEPGAIYGKQVKQDTAWYKQPCLLALLAILVGVTLSAENNQDETTPAPPGTTTITIPTL